MLVFKEVWCRVARPARSSLFVQWRNSGQSVASSLFTSHKFQITSLGTSTEVRQKKKYLLPHFGYRNAKKKMQGEFSWYSRLEKGVVVLLGGGNRWY